MDDLSICVNDGVLSILSTRQRKGNGHAEVEAIKRFRFEETSIDATKFSARIAKGVLIISVARRHPESFVDAEKPFSSREDRPWDDDGYETDGREETQ